MYVCSLFQVKEMEALVKRVSEEIEADVNF
jgi:hypothetical protein